MQVNLLRNPADRISNLLKWVFLILIAVFMLFPFYWALNTSFKPQAEVVAKPPIFFPKNPVGLDNYIEVFNRIPLTTYYKNSLIVAVAVTVAKLFSSSLAGYIFAKYKFPGSRFLFILVLATMMIPFQVIAIPVYLLFNQFQLLDTLWALIIPNLVSAFGIFLMRQFIISIPTELMDAARIDGCSEFGIYWKIVLPQCGPALSALGILVFMHSWDDFFWPILALETKKHFTLPFGLHTFGAFTGFTYYTHLLMAAAVLSILPVLIFFFFAQRQFIEGMTMTGIKG